MPDGVDFAASDTLGLSVGRDGRVLAGCTTMDYPGFVYRRDHSPPDVPEFLFTSINVNKDYGAKLHRDRTSRKAIAALGAAMAFREAGWPSWRRGRGAAMTCCGASHSTGERFSIVFFQAKNCSSAPEALRTEPTRCGIQVPSTPSCVKAIDLLRVNDFKSFVVPSERKERKKEKFSLEKDKLALEKEKEQR